ncbi:HD domain-containing protein [Pararhizobium sp. BT-229]|uniref:HD domain-containing protein n=1 Tax=Pararhizobium sp. BT-229 TaxID=2986923 RepID=UPI0021F6E1F3|nr:HD domain-containing protein [Pararhizobium sp. BT-229]MCV9964268.1 HD domain-containing protein [Pararhizobium sp. BT-229]
MPNIPPSKAAVIEAVALDIEKLLADEGSGHDWQHIHRVWKTAERLGYMENADGFVVSLAALLHDVDDRKLTGDISTEETVPTARRIMGKAGVDPAVLETVCETIKMTGFHKSLDGGRSRTLEAHILSDADQLDAIGAVGIARTFVYGASRKRSMFDPSDFPMQEFTAAQYDANKGSTVNHFFEKLLKLRDRMHTESGRLEAEKRHATMVSFLDDFFEESAAPRDWKALLDKYRPAPSSQVTH